MKKDVVYFAYGANMNPVRMKRCCPGAKIIGGGMLFNYRLAEREYADIDREDGSLVEGVLYRISEKDLERLDRRNGFPETCTRLEVEVRHDLKIFKAQTYEMTPQVKKQRDGIPYSDAYRKCCAAGESRFGLSNVFRGVNILSFGPLKDADGELDFRQNVITSTPCTVTGALYDTGDGYPVFTADGDTQVHAELIDIPMWFWPEMDRLAGCPERSGRKFVVVTLPGGNTTGGWAYVANTIPPRAEPIRSGSWREWRAARESAVPAIRPDFRLLCAGTAESASGGSGRVVEFDEVKFYYVGRKTGYSVCILLSGIVFSLDWNSPEHGMCEISTFWVDELSSRLNACRFEEWRDVYRSTDAVKPKWMVELLRKGETVFYSCGYNEFPPNWNDFEAALDICYRFTGIRGHRSDLQGDEEEAGRRT